ncbi:hypothetical protein ACRAVF_03980 [Bradyrhizobium oligotrophicum S58]
MTELIDDRCLSRESATAVVSDRLRRAAIGTKLRARWMCEALRMAAPSPLVGEGM